MYLEEKQRTNKVPHNIFIGLEVRKNVRLIFRMANNSTKGKY